MNNSLEIKYIKKCLELIETRLNWGASSEWKGYDFEKLSIEIQEVTTVVLSVTTLKRLWGKLKYTNVPTATTLNTLAKFAGYQDWRTFKYKEPLEHAATPVPEVAIIDVAVTEKVIKKTFGKWKYWSLGFFLLLIAGCFLLLSNVKTKAPIDTSAYKFSSNKIKLEGVPNSVIFNYDAAAASTDSVFITQSWDVSRKVTVPRQKNIYSTIYYNPGYYRAKLIIENKIVKEHDLMISSDGWMAMIYKNGNVPLYFKKNEVLKSHKVEVNEELLSRYNLSLQPSLPALRFYNVQDMGGIKNDHFIFETSLKSDFNQGTAACQRVDVLIMCKNDVIIIPLSSKGCIGDLSLYAAGMNVQSKDADLSKFGCDLDQWVELRVESKNRHMRFFVNGEQAYSLTFPNDPTDIIGLQYRFNGTGAVKNTRLIKDHQVISLE